MAKGGIQRHHEACTVSRSHVSEPGPDVGHLHRIVEGVFGTGKSAASAAARRCRRGARSLKGSSLRLRLNGREPALKSHDGQESIDVLGELMFYRDLRKALPQITVITHDGKIDQVRMGGHDRCPIHARRDSRPTVVRGVLDVG